ncbi:MAG: DUF4340 domain-containing protein [Clostridia bacterium]|nr:DUF4340 domain-containing protein [Clostridia bacterium]
MTQETKFPTTAPKRWRSSLKRQRLAVFISLGVVVVLAVAFAIVYALTSKILVEYPNGDNVVDTDGTKYYAVQKNGVWVVQNQHGDVCETTSEGFYKTKDGTLIRVNAETGEPTVVATVLLNGTEDKIFNYGDGEYDILLYPMLERADLTSIEVANEKDRFKFVKDKDNTWVIEGHETTPYDATMFATLVVVTGYTRTLAKLDLSPENPDAEGFRQNGYAEYGLPDDPANATRYFILTAEDGTVHKVIIGDLILDDTGYYARYEGRDDVYVLSQMEESEYNSTLSATLLGVIEDYVTPTVSTTIGSSNYFDMTDFTVQAAKDPKDISTLEQRVQFSYEPIEVRQNTFYSSTPYVGKGVLAGYAIDDLQADTCLLNMMDLAPVATIKLYDTDPEDSLISFIQEYGVAYTIEFTYNQERLGEVGGYKPVKDKQVNQQIWISPMVEKEDGSYVYYMFNELFNMVVETERAFLEFLEWDSFRWVKREIFDGNVAYMEKMEITLRDNAASSTPLQALISQLNGKTNITFEVSFVDDGGNAVAGSADGANMKLFAKYGVVNESFTQVTKFKQFYQTLLYTSLSGAMATDSDAEQAAIIAGGADMTITLTFNVDGKSVVRTYCFYAYQPGGRQCFVTVDGNGGFYVKQLRMEKIVSDVVKLLDSTVTVISPREES